MTRLEADGATSADAALQALFTQWGLGAAGTESQACAEAEANDLRCLELESPQLSDLHELDRPATLELIGADGLGRHLLLLGLSGTHAMIWVDGVADRVTIEELAGARFSRSLMLFRPAITTSDMPLIEGARGPSVIWLRASLESLGHEQIASSEPDVFDAALAAVVGEFQRTHGLLPADGVVGDRTLARLQSAIGLVEVALNSWVD
jgi:hypothetical protein